MSDTIKIYINQTQPVKAITVAPTGARGAAGTNGTNGTNGGSTNAWDYNAKTNATSGYPGNGYLLWNNATQTSATSIIVSHLTDDDTDIELFLSFFVLNQKIFIQNRDDSSQNQVWRITGTPTVTGANTSTAYYTFPVTLVSSAGAAFTNNHSLLFGQIVVATNSVTSATTSDGTADLDVDSIIARTTILAQSVISTNFVNSIQHVVSDPTGEFGSSIKATNITTDRIVEMPDASGTVSLIANTETLTNKTLTSPTINSATIGTAATFNATSYTYGTGAASAHKAALDLFTLLTLQESDAGVYTANGGSAAASSDGDSLNLTTATANIRPNVYRFRNWNRNPGTSGAANVVMPVSLASAGNIIHSGSGANGASFRCGFGMVNGASAVAADANATTGRGFGWRIAWNASTSKLEFNLWAHDGTTYVEGNGIDTGLGAANLDGFFNVIVRLASDGTVTAHTWFGNNSAASVPSLTPTVTLAGGPTSGAFANLGIPLWLAATHSTVAPSGAQSIIAKIINRKLYIG